MIAATVKAAAGADWLACCGSLPPGAPTDLYAQLLDAWAAPRSRSPWTPPAPPCGRPGRPSRPGQAQPRGARRGRRPPAATVGDAVDAAEELREPAASGPCWPASAPTGRCWSTPTGATFGPATVTAPQHRRAPATATLAGFLAAGGTGPPPSPRPWPGARPRPACPAAACRPPPTSTTPSPSPWPTASIRIALSRKGADVHERPDHRRTGRPRPDRRPSEARPPGRSPSGSAAGRVTDLDGFLADVAAREAQMPTGLRRRHRHPALPAAARHRADPRLRPQRPRHRLRRPGRPGDLIFLIAAPEGGGAEHMTILAALARGLMNNEFQDRCSRRRTPRPSSAIVKKEVLGQ